MIDSTKALQYSQPEPEHGEKLTHRADGRWCKWYKGKTYYLGTGSREQAAEAWSRIKADLTKGRTAKHAKASRLKDEGADILTRRDDGRWCKWCKGKMHYLGRGSHDDAMREWLRIKEDALAGRKPRPAQPNAVTLSDLCNAHLAAKRKQLGAGELAFRSWLTILGTYKRMIDKFGRNRAANDITIDEWQELRSKLAESRGPVALGNEIQRVRSLYKWAWEAGHIEQPMRFGPDFKRPSKKAIRLAVAERGPKLFTAEQCIRLIDAADVHLKAMIYLGLNCGFGNSDCGTLPLDRLDLENGWHNYHRPKTGIERRCPLWPETIAALRASLAKRPKPKDEVNSNLVFVTKFGNSWAKQQVADQRAEDNPITKEFVKLLKENGLHRAGLGFYALRHTHRTAADGANDQVAANAIMGHVDESMAAVYRQTIEDDRLEAITDHVRTWLTAARKEKKKRKRLVVRAK